jgi:hypothetical protein
MFINEWKPLEEKAIQAGISRELAALIYNVARDADGHDWRADLKEWIGDDEATIRRALEHPEKMKQACELLLATDGLTYDEGQLFAGISDGKRTELESWILGIEDEDENSIYGEEPEPFNPKKMAIAIAILQRTAKRDSGSGHVCRQFFKACEQKAEIDFADLELLDTEDSFAMMMVFQGLLFDSEKTLPLLGHLVTRNEQ